MSKTIQFRCPVCCRMLFKWETSKETIQARADVRFINTPEGKMDVVCTKCNTRLQIHKDGLHTIELSETPLNDSGLSNHIAAPELVGPQTRG